MSKHGLNLQANIGRNYCIFTSTIKCKEVAPECLSSKEKKKISSKFGFKPEVFIIVN